MGRFARRPSRLDDDALAALDVLGRCSAAVSGVRWTAPGPLDPIDPFDAFDAHPELSWVTGCHTDSGRLE